MPAKIPVLTASRIIPRDNTYLDVKTGALGEVFYDKEDNTLRLYDGQTQGGSPLAKSDLSNVSNTDFLNKAVSAGVGSSGSSFNQTLNTTDNVTFNTVRASQLISTGTGTPTYTSGSDFIFNTGNNSGTLVINGSIDITKVLTLVPQSTPPFAIAGSFAVANGLTGGWDPASKGLNLPYPVFYNGSSWQALY